MPGIKRGKSNILIDDEYNIDLKPATGKQVQITTTAGVSLNGVAGPGLRSPTLEELKRH